MDNLNPIHPLEMECRKMGAKGPVRAQASSSSPHRFRFLDRLRLWLKPAGSAGGVYLLAGGTCPCCGGTCPVGIGGAAVVGGMAALLMRCWRWVRPEDGNRSQPHRDGGEYNAQ